MKFVWNYWKNWTKKEKREWILSSLISGTDYSDEIETDRLKENALICSCKKGYTCVMCTMELMDEENLLE